MDFRSIDVGIFVYHCHILGHEDNGMMAKVCASVYYNWNILRPSDSCKFWFEHFVSVAVVAYVI